MNQRSHSQNRIDLYVPQKSRVIGSQRLMFPKKGDSLMYVNMGRKHYYDNTDYIHQLILNQQLFKNSPQKKPIAIPSIPKRHSIPEIAHKIYKDDYIHSNVPTPSNTHGINPEKISTLNASKMKVSRKVDDELDRMQQLYNKKSLHQVLPNQSITPSIQAISPQKRSYSLPKLQRRNHSESNIFSTMNPYQPRLKNEQAEALLRMRSRNPTHLSTGLSII